MATQGPITGTPVRAPSIPVLPRRRLLGALALVPIAALPAGLATCSATSPVTAAITASKAAEARFNALPYDLEETDPAKFSAEEDRMSDAWRFACEQTPVTLGEYVALFELMTADGAFGLDEDRAATMLDHARRLSSRH